VCANERRAGGGVCFAATHHGTSDVTRHPVDSSSCPTSTGGSFATEESSTTGACGAAGSSSPPRTSD
jgi:hypothetical protein